MSDAAARVWSTLQAADWQKVFTTLGPFIGFFLGWGLFEVTERRKVRLAQRELRHALVAELQHAELLLSTIVAKYAFTAKTPQEIKACADEIRWFRQVGESRATQIGISSPVGTSTTLAKFDALTDEKLVAMMVSITPQEKLGRRLILPVIDAVLAGRTAGFTGNQIQSLSTVRWQAYLLEQDADWMDEFLRLTFSVEDEENHATVVTNLDNRAHAYAFRAGVLQQCIRVSLKAFGSENSDPNWTGDFF